MNSWVYLAVLAAGQPATDGKAEQVKPVAEGKTTAAVLRAPPPPPPIVAPPAIEVAAAVRQRPPQPNQVVEPTSPRARWLRGGDYPSDAIDEKREGTTKVRLVINDGGRVNTCTVTASSGHSDLDEAACSAIERRAYFHPATDADAQPITSTYSHTVIWKLNDEEAGIETTEAVPPPRRPRMYNTSFPSGPRMEFNRWDRPGLNDYPDGARDRGSEGRVRISVAIGADSKVAGCSVDEPVDDAELNAASCDLAKLIEITQPAMDVDGNPVAGRIVRTINWQLPAEETVVTPSRYSRPAFTRRPVKMPFIGNGKAGFEIEAKADGSVISCERINEGELAEAMDFTKKFCDDALSRGVDLRSPDGKQPANDGMGMKLRFEMNIKSEKLDNADKQPAKADVAADE